MLKILTKYLVNPAGGKLIFWYDAEAEFVDDVDAIELSNAKIYRLEKDNQFYTKYFLECRILLQTIWFMPPSLNLT